MPKSVTFDSIAPLDGTLVASGQVQRMCAGPDATACRRSHGAAHQHVGPVVWSSSDDGYRWTQTWTPGRTLIGASSGPSRLVQAPDGSLLLFDSVAPGIVVLHATNPSSWTTLSLPAPMATDGLSSVTDTGTELVASMINSSGSLTTFTSSTGMTWQQSSSAPHIPLQMEGDGLGVVSYGASPGQVESILNPTLSTPSATPVSGCAYDTGPPQFTEIEWNELAVEFNEGFFVGYRDILGGLNSSSTTGNPDPDITTATGIGLGATFAQLEKAYPDLQQTGSFTWTSPDGIHFVFGSATPMSAQSTIDEIKTGTCGDF
jgi:hypothetical protein